MISYCRWHSTEFVDRAIYVTNILKPLLLLLLLQTCESSNVWGKHQQSSKQHVNGTQMCVSPNYSRNSQQLAKARYDQCAMDNTVTTTTTTTITNTTTDNMYSLHTQTLFRKSYLQSCECWLTASVPHLLFSQFFLKLLQIMASHGTEKKPTA